MKKSKNVILIGAGIMSSTLAVLLKQLDPTIKIKVFEMLNWIAAESSGAMNNAGTGHAGLCEMNYTPERKDGTISIKKAVEVNRDFNLSKEFWSFLVKSGYLSQSDSFIHKIPHYSFVYGEKNVEYLRKRFESLNQHEFFKNMNYSQDKEEISKWIPLVMEGRSESDVVAATRAEEGTDVNFEALTKQMFQNLVDKNEIELHCTHMVKDIIRDGSKWKLNIKNLETKEKIEEDADFVFIGAGGGSILLLEKSNIPESKKYGGFPVGGEWLICENEEVVEKHSSKVYGRAKVGAPPMSVPHLDTRIIDGKKKLLFGPFATFSTKFLKNGSYLDLFKSLQVESLGFMTQAGYRNMDLTKYLIQQVSLSKKEKIDQLKEYLPTARIEDWVEESAGQRVQVIKKDDEKGGELQFGTEVVSAKDGSLSALLGASPGASTSVSVMLSVLEKCFSEEMSSESWKSKLKAMVPSYGSDQILSDRNEVNNILKIS